MKKLSGPVVGLAMLAIGIPALAGVDWIEHPAYEDVLEKAKTENKYVLIDFYTVWCGPCKRMDRGTYLDANVGDFLGEMIPVKYDSEKGPGIDVSKQFRISNWPTQVLLDASGNEVGRYVGYLDAADFVTIMGDFKEGKGTIAYYEKKLEANPEDATGWKTLGTMYAEAREADKSITALNQYLVLAQSPTRDDQAEVFYAMADVLYATGSPDKAVPIAEGILQDYQDTQYFDPATTLLARSYFKTGQTKQCIETYMTYVNRYPDDPAALNSFAWFCASRQVGLDEALPIAIKAVDLTNREPGYLDTLAELYYARDEFDLAIQIGQEAAEKDPDDPYFKGQVEKFRRAKAAGTSAGNP